MNRPHRICVLSLFLAVTWPATANDLPRAKPEPAGLSSGRLERVHKFIVTLVARHGKIEHFEPMV